jgi:hypothetical protein
MSTHLQLTNISYQFSLSTSQSSAVWIIVINLSFVMAELELQYVAVEKYV